MLITIPAEYAASNAKTTLNIYSDSKLVSEQTIMFSNSILQNFQLLQNFPNPFNGTTVIAYTIPQSARTTKVILSIFDVTGKLIKTLVNTIVQPGNYSVSWNGTNSEGFSVSSGIYYYRLTAGTFQETRKIVYEK
ncbi:MAG: T9SS type A sorting domain-containing protein [Bacteroidetes bacterium]|nr:T9SS type A sorting domain-containing protein [Bacteroidota bacterium]